MTTWSKEGLVRTRRQTLFSLGTRGTVRTVTKASHQPRQPCQERESAVSMALVCRTFGARWSSQRRSWPLLLKPCWAQLFFVIVCLRSDRDRGDLPLCLVVCGSDRSCVVEFLSSQWEPITVRKERDGKRRKRGDGYCRFCSETNAWTRSKCQYHPPRCTYGGGRRRKLGRAEEESGESWKWSASARGATVNGFRVALFSMLQRLQEIQVEGRDG